MKILSKQNFNQNESKNFVVDNLSSAPSDPILGQVYYNTQNERAYVCIKSGETPEWADLSLQEEVSIGGEEPNGRDVKIWINPEDMASSSDYDSLPIGSIIPYSGETAPEGYSICDGKELNRETYKELFSIIGTTFGNGDGTSTFNLPDLKGRISVGLDSSDTDFDALGKTGGEKTHTLTINEMPSHNHGLYTDTQPGHTVNSWGVATTIKGSTLYANSQRMSYTGNSLPHNNMPPYLVLNYIIKIYGEAMLTGDVIDSLEGDSSYNAPSIRAVNEAIGQIIESGDGYIKYSDGTMICYGNYSGTTKLADYFNWCKRTEENIIVTFKKEFISAPTVIIIPLYFSYVFSVMLNQIKTTGFGFTGLKVNGAAINTSVQIHYMALGKWKSDVQTASEEPSSDESIVSDEIISEEPTI